jgi:hypothetical protein
MILRCIVLAIGLLAGLAGAAEPAVMPPPRNTGPAAMSHSRYRQHHRKTVRTIRRTPEVMREDAARVKRGDLFSTWSNRYLE